MAGQPPISLELIRALKVYAMLDDRPKPQRARILGTPRPSSPAVVEDSPYDAWLVEGLRETITRTWGREENIVEWLRAQRNSNPGA
jgi:hypothetical protein